MSSCILLGNEPDQVIAAVRSTAQAEIMPRFLQVTFERKCDGSLCTAADIAAQASLQNILPQIIPCPVLGEEMSAEEQKSLWANGQSGLWVVDPIDGTTNFAHGIPHFAISVAYFREGRPLLGVVYNPASAEVFHAVRGKGAYLNGQRLPLTRQITQLRDAVAGVDVKHMGGKLPARLSSVMPYNSQRTFGASTLDWCYLAAGRLDIYVHGGQKLWDYAAGCLILSEAGGKLASLLYEDFWHDDPWDRSVIAARDAELFSAWCAWVRANQ